MITHTRKVLHGALIRAANLVERPGNAVPQPVTHEPSEDAQPAPHDLGEETRTLWERVQSRTMTSVYRIDALRQAVEYIEANAIPGDIVECGVWRGGSIMAVALTLSRLGARRALWLYDTFCGMPPPGPQDKDFEGRSAADLMAEQAPETSPIWALNSLEDVRAGMAEVGYPRDLVRYVVGPVESTIPDRVPDRIALLRLDTDWFTSTHHELVHLWPRLAVDGILIIDDYGYWRGAKKAVDQYFREAGLYPFLHRIDETGRLVIKTHALIDSAPDGTFATE
jgi:O-methyltransferase